MNSTRKGRKPAPIVMSRNERLLLEAVVRDPEAGGSRANRCRAILLSAQGLTNVQVASVLGVTTSAVWRWRRRFLDGRLDGLLGECPTNPIRPSRNGGAFESAAGIPGVRVRSRRPIRLSNKERSRLEDYVRRQNGSGIVALRCQMILRCAEGSSNEKIAAELDVATSTVARWRRRFLQHRIDGLLSKRTLRSGRRFSDENEVPTNDRCEGSSGRRRHRLSLSEEDRSLLERLAQSRSGAGIIANRCRMILRIAEGSEYRNVALELGVAPRTVRRWRDRFVKDGIEGLLSKPGASSDGRQWGRGYRPNAGPKQPSGRRRQSPKRRD